MGEQSVDLAVRGLGFHRQGFLSGLLVFVHRGAGTNALVPLFRQRHLAAQDMRAFVRRRGAPVQTLATGNNGGRMTGIGDKHHFVGLGVNRRQPRADFVVQDVVIVHALQPATRAVRHPGFVLGDSFIIFLPLQVTHLPPVSG